MTSARRVVAIGAVCLALGGAFVTVRLSNSHWNPSWFTFAGDRWVNAAEAPPSLHVRKDSYGFDGVGFYRVALDPFTRRVTDFGITFDLPAFRMQRIVYPLLVRATTGGDPSSVAWGLIAWNLAGMAALGMLGALLARSAGRPEWWGLPLALAPAFALSLGLDTAEIVAGAFLFAGLLLLRQSRWAWATVALSFAALTRETTLVVPIAGVAVWAWRRIKARDVGPPLWVFVIPGALQAAWQLVLWRRWGVLPMSQGSSVDVGLPLRGLLRGMGEWLPSAKALDVFHLTLLIAIVLFTYTVARSLRRSGAPAHERVAWTIMAVAMPLFSVGIWFHHWGFLRALSEFTVLGALVLLSDERAPVHRLWFGVAVWGSIAVQLALYP